MRNFLMLCLTSLTLGLVGCASTPTQQGTVATTAVAATTVVSTATGSQIPADAINSGTETAATVAALQQKCNGRLVEVRREYHKSCPTGQHYNIGADQCRDASGNPTGATPVPNGRWKTHWRCEGQQVTTSPLPAPPQEVVPTQKPAPTILFSPTPASAVKAEAAPRPALRAAPTPKKKVTRKKLAPKKPVDECAVTAKVPQKKTEPGRAQCSVDVPAGFGGKCEVTPADGTVGKKLEEFKKEVERKLDQLLDDTPAAAPPATPASPPAKKSSWIWS